MIDSGTLAPVELSAAEAELERRVDTYFSSITLLTEVENALKLLIAGGRDAEIWNDGIIPTDERTIELSGGDELRAAISTALQSRPEMRQIGLRTESNDIQKELAEDQVKPQVNLVGNYVNSGLAGSVLPGDNPFAAGNVLLYQRVNALSALSGLPPISPPVFGGAPGHLIGGYGSVLSSLFGGNYQTFQVGLAMDWSPRNRTAKANLSQTAINERRLKLERDRIEQAIAAEVRNAMQALETSRQRIIAADASARAAKEKLDSETRLFQTGESTNFLVLTRQNEYSDSRHRVLMSRLDFNKAVARLRQAMGTTLNAHKLSVK
jgi:HAE1 family hydrophobic/amphiphilic exporter-1